MKKENDTIGGDQITDLDKNVQSDIGGVVDNAVNLARSIFDVTSDSMGFSNDKFKDSVLSWMEDVESISSGRIDDIHRSVRSFFNEENPLQKVFPGVYESRDSQGKEENAIFDPSLWRNGLSSIFEGSHWGGKTPFGLFSQSTPGIRSYNKCLEVNGQSVWDDEGRWRCLFPNAEIPNKFLEWKKKHYPNKIFTKEEFDSEVQSKGFKKEGTIDLGDRGIYFTKFDDFLNWKNSMYKNVLREREDRRAAILKEKEQMQLQRQSQALDAGANKSVVSSYVVSSYNTNVDTNQVEMRETRTESFSDGSSSTKEITRYKPLGASEWANVTENVHNTDAIKSKGWFWNSKDD